MMRKILMVTVILIGLAGMAKADMWTQKADFGGACRNGIGGFSIGNKGYMGGGIKFYPRIIENDFWEYDPIANVWTQKADYPDSLNGFYFAVSFSINGYGYMGLYGNTNPFYQYDPVNNFWTAKANYPGLANELNIGFAIGNKGYVGLGGISYMYFISNDFWEYDPATDIWTRKADFGGGNRWQSFAFSIGNKGYVGGGVNDTNWVHDFWEYDAANDLWIQKTDFPLTHTYLGSCFAIGSNGYVCNGSSDSISLGTFWKYNTLSNTWTPLTIFNTLGFYGGAGFTIGNKGYVYTGDSATNLFWEYDPNSWTSIQELPYSPTIFIALSPNPASENLIVKTEHFTSKNTELKIYDEQGKLVYQQFSTLLPNQSAQLSIDISKFTYGIYLLQATNGKETVTKKFVKE